MTLAKTNSIKKGEQIIEEINTVVNNWSDFAVKNNVNEKLRIPIQNNLHSL